MSNVIPIPEPAQRAQADRDAAILFDKQQRVNLAFIIDDLKRQAHQSPERLEAIIHLKNARHWLGEDLSTLGTARPYPNGDNCTNTIVDPPTDMGSLCGCPAGEPGVEGVPGKP